MLGAKRRPAGCKLLRFFKRWGRQDLHMSAFWGLCIFKPCAPLRVRAGARLQETEVTLNVLHTVAFLNEPIIDLAVLSVERGSRAR